jgi:hypothetical protein
MKCQIQRIDEKGKPTSDDNDAVMIAHAHEPKWSLPCGGLGNKIIGYSAEIRDSFPICAAHYARVTHTMRFPAGGWSFSGINQGEE